MMRIMLLVALLVAGACGSEAPPPESSEAEDAQAKPEHFLSEHHKAMDKARALQDQLNTSAQDRLDEVDRQTRDDSED